MAQELSRLAQGTRGTAVSHPRSCTWSADGPQKQVVAPGTGLRAPGPPPQPLALGSPANLVLTSKLQKCSPRPPSPEPAPTAVLGLTDPACPEEKAGPRALGAKTRPGWACACLEPGRADGDCAVSGPRRQNYTPPPRENTSRQELLKVCEGVQAGVCGHAGLEQTPSGKAVDVSACARKCECTKKQAVSPRRRRPPASQAPGRLSSGRSGDFCTGHWLGPTQDQRVPPVP